MAASGSAAEASAAMPSSAVAPAASSTMPAAAAAEPAVEEWIAVRVKHGSAVHSLRLAHEDLVEDLKAAIFSLTDIPPERQKILGLSRGRLPPDSSRISQLAPPPSSWKGRSELGERILALQVIGTPLVDTFKDPAALLGLEDARETAALSEDVDYQAPQEEAKAQKTLLPHENPKNHAKLEKTIQRFGDFPVMHPPRSGLKGGLLVLDLDYTIADTKVLLDNSRLASESIRPGLHDFLAAVYPYYDICVWSQTSWRWLEAKLTELNMLADPRYRISFVIDRTPMFSVKSLMWEKPDITKPAVQTEYKHEVKALELIWRRFPEHYSAANTLHVDDLSRNFAMNPANGLKITPYRKAPRFDSELAALKRYCLQLAHPNVTNFNEACPNNADWKYVQLPLVTDLPQSTTVAATPDTPRPAAGELPQETDETMAAAAPADAAAAAPTAAESTEGAAPDAAELQRLSSTPTPPPSSSQSLSQATAQQPGTQADTPDVAGPPQAD